MREPFPVRENGHFAQILENTGSKNCFKRFGNEKNTKLGKTNQDKSGNPGHGQSFSYSSQDVLDGELKDSLDGEVDGRRADRLHSLIRENNYRKFRWFTSLFLSDTVQLEELCQSPVEGEKLSDEVRHRGGCGGPHRSVSSCLTLCS